MKKKLLCLIVTLLLCVPPICAADLPTGAERFAGKSPEGIVEEFVREHHLSDGEFTMSYRNLVTGESFGYHELEMMVAASTYKVPLNLYYYRMENNGEIAPDAFIPNAGMTLDKAHERSLVLSDNDVSEGMIYYLGGFRIYKQAMRDFFTLTDDEIDEQYYYGNLYCARMMTDALQWLYDRAEDYQPMLELMKRAQPEQGYFRRDVTELEVAHKYGSYEGAENDVGIFFAEQPFALAVYTRDTLGEEYCAQFARLMTDYNLYRTEAQKQQEQQGKERLAAEQKEKERLAAIEAENVRLAEAQREAERLAAEREAAEKARAKAAEEAAALQQKQQTVIGGADGPTEIFVRTPVHVTWWMIAAAAGIVLLALGFVRLFSGRKLKKRLRKKYDGKFEKKN